jgi:hypothetical protein
VGAMRSDACSPSTALLVREAWLARKGASASRVEFDHFFKGPVSETKASPRRLFTAKA